QQDIVRTRPAVQRAYEGTTPPIRRLMDYAGLDPPHALLRWGNFDQTLLFPSKVFEPDDTGRSYRLLPKRKAVWVRNITLRSSVLGFFLVPDGPGLAAAVGGTGGVVVTTSVQTTNSWGCRGLEPNLAAPIRGIVLGDSYMQGMFIGDKVTPPVQL